MLKTNIYFDICAFFIFAVLLVYHLIKKKIPFMQYRVYTLIAGCGILSTLFDIVGVLALNSISNATVMTKYLANIFYYIFDNLTITAFLLFILCIAKIDISQAIHRCLIWIPYVIVFLLVVTTGATHLVFYFDEHEVFTRGVLCASIYFVFIYDLIYAGIIIAMYRKLFTIKQLIALCSIIVLAISAMLIQAFFPALLVENFTFALCCVITVFFIQNPDEVYDETTGAMRYSMFVKFLGSEFISRKKFAILIVHIRDYRIIQEKLGSEGVDKIFAEIVKFLSKLQKNCIVSRINNRAFAVKIKDIHGAGIEDCLKKIQARFDSNWKNGNDTAVLTEQTTVIKCPEDIRTVSEFYDAVDAVMRVKNIKKPVINLGDIVDVVHIDAVRAAIRNAVAENGFEVYYQPIYSTEKKKIIAAEALVRLNDKELGFISPEIFIPMAEKDGFILDIGEFVFESVCKFISEENIRQKGIEYIEVNLSVVQCMQHKLADRFISIMKKYNVPPESIVFEITETAAVSSVINLTRNIDAFTENGIKFALDDFGTGYSNISYVYTLPFECVKIDKSILWSSLDNPKAYATLKSTFLMLQQLGVEVVMEGVETVEQIEKLLQLKCDYFQGYYFSKAVSGTDFVNYINNFSLTPELCG